MLTGLFYLLIFLSLGELIRLGVDLPVPASIIGMMLLLAFITIKSRIPKSLVTTATQITPLLPLFIIPVSAGLITQRELLEQFGWQLLVILTASLIPGAVITGLVMKLGKNND